MDTISAEANPAVARLRAELGDMRRELEEQKKRHWELQRVLYQSVKELKDMVRELREDCETELAAVENLAVHVEEDRGAGEVADDSELYL